MRKKSVVFLGGGAEMIEATGIESLSDGRSTLALPLSDAPTLSRALADSSTRFAVVSAEGAGTDPYGYSAWQGLWVMSIEGDIARRHSLVFCYARRWLGESSRCCRRSFGVTLSEQQARLFAFACRRRGASLAEAKAVTGRSGPEARKVLDALAVQGLLEPLGDAGRYGLTEHIKDSLDAAQLGQSTSDQVREGVGGLVSDQPGRPDAHLVTPR